MLSTIVRRSIVTMAQSSTTVRPKFAAEGQPFTVFIEGNIGSGKTTFLNYFKKFDEVCLQAEPVEKWRDVAGVNLLDLMYKDPERWAMPFQTYVTLTMLQTHTLATEKSIKLMERSLFSARYCFVENMLTNGVLHQGMYNVMQEWYKYIRENVHIQADLIVYLRTTPEVVYERMKARARSEEKCIPFEYLKQLHELHENWLVHGHHERPAPVLMLDADLPIEDITKEYERSEQSILSKKPILIENTNQQALYTTPTKRQRTN
ncbi:deoxynucleoside kinase isoform X1 [Bradysia coprophila]|uniref:deoxynucleoside kinase isoform X1 n=2 Tax=Bradysia coprophila TaxID=38358 RepID=UPI00187DD72A|nr:deoxynucleoside kinase isoform X1 [Bradysia coprophila]